MQGLPYRWIIVEGKRPFSDECDYATLEEAERSMSEHLDYIYAPRVFIVRHEFAHDAEGIPHRVAYRYYKQNGDKLLFSHEVVLVAKIELYISIALLFMATLVSWFVCAWLFA